MLFYRRRSPMKHLFLVAVHHHQQHTHVDKSQSWNSQPQQTSDSTSQLVISFDHRHMTPLAPRIFHSLIHHGKTLISTMFLLLVDYPCNNWWLTKQLKQQSASTSWQAGWPAAWPSAATMVGWPWRAPCPVVTGSAQDTLASRTAAMADDTADNSIGNITGSDDSQQGRVVN